MDTLRLSCVIVCVFCLTTIIVASPHQESHNVTHWAKSRQKRFLYYNTGGVCKYIISYAMPVDLMDKRPWRALSSAWNMQWQHTLPTTIQYWWNSTYFPSKGRSWSGGTVPSAPQPIDLTAMFLYAMIENYMNSQGMSGRECLQRAICENAQVHYIGGVFDQIFKRLLTPERSMAEHYRDSFTMGSSGVDCVRTFAKCPKGSSVFDQFVRIDVVK